LWDFLKAASKEDGKALNGLDFGRSAVDTASPPFSTDIVACMQTHNSTFCLEKYPSSTMRWGLCATAGAFHRCHKDCDGFGTFVSPESGVKLWIIGLPKNGGSYDDLADIEMFLKGYNAWEANGDLFDWVALVLKPGMQL
jgi:hypothetical protein